MTQLEKYVSPISKKSARRVLEVTAILRIIACSNIGGDSPSYTCSGGVRRGSFGVSAQLPPGPRERNRAPPEAGPGVTCLVEPVEDGADGDAIGPKIFLSKLAPVEWQGDGGTGAGPLAWGPADHDAGQVPGKVANRVEPLPALERYDDVKTPGAGGLEVGGQFEIVQQLLECLGGGPDRLEVLALGIEVEHHLVG